MTARPCYAKAVKGCHQRIAGGNGRGGVLVASVRLLFQIVHLNRVKLHAHFKGLQVNLADRLFAAPCGNAAILSVAAVVFLIVQGEMLYKGVQTLFGGFLYGGRCHAAGHKGILRIVFVVSAAERGAVDVGGRAVPAHRAGAKQGVIAKQAAEFQRQLAVPSLCGHLGAVKRCTAGAAKHKTRSRIGIHAVRFADILQFGGAVAGGADQGLVITGRQLIQKGIPQGVIIRLAAQVDQTQAVLGTVNDGVCKRGGVSRIAGVSFLHRGKEFRRGGFLVLVAYRVAVGIRAVDLIAPSADDIAYLAAVLREGPRPIAAGQQCEIAARRIKLVGDLRAGLGVNGVGRCIKLRLRIHGSEIGVAVLGHAVRHGVALRSQNVVDCLMRILGCGNVVVARI